MFSGSNSWRYPIALVPQAIASILTKLIARRRDQPAAPEEGRREGVTGRA
jgi:hypothetical protein